MAARISAPAIVRSSVNYLGPMDEAPMFFAGPEDANNLNLEEHEIAVRDFRLCREETGFDTTGFTLLDHPVDAERMREPDYAQKANRELAEQILALTGASRVELTLPTYRWSERELHPEMVNSKPGRFVHVDYSRDSFHQFARQYWGNDTAAEALSGRRYAAINIWRVLTPPPQDCPLGCVDRRTIASEDVVEGTAVIEARDRKMRFGSSIFRHNPAHRWGYFSDMTPDEALVFLAYDSADDTLPGCPHSAFDLPENRTNSVPRSSCEMRAFVYWDAEATD